MSHIIACTDLIGAFQDQANPEDNLRYFEAATSYGYLGRAEAREQLLQQALRLAGTSSVDPHVLNKFATSAEREMVAQVNEDTTDPRYQLFLGGFLSRFQHNDEALQYLLAAEKNSPTKQQILMQVATTYLLQEKYDDAFAVAEKTYNLEKNYFDARVVYAMTALYDKKDAVFQTLTNADSSLLNDSRIIRTLIALKKFDQAISILKKQIVANPADYQAHMSLASAYWAARQTSRAVAEVQIVIDANPSFKDQGQAYIKQIQAGK